jgi:hypothetical protein
LTGGHDLNLWRQHMQNMIPQTFYDDFSNADMILIGIGEEILPSLQEPQLQSLVAYFNTVCEHKNYFIITSYKNDLLRNEPLNQKRLVNPLNMNEVEEKQWDLYNKWMSATLNKKLLIIELGENFNQPNLFRWPFERITFINQKAKMYRIHGEFAQLPENISDRAISISMNANDFINALQHQE